MSLWIVFALMTGGALFAVLWPFRRRSMSTPAETDKDAAVYRDQLREIERDLAAGSIGASEAEAARIEVSRRLLAADQAETARVHEQGTIIGPQTAAFCCLGRARAHGGCRQSLSHARLARPARTTSRVAPR